MTNIIDYSNDVSYEPEIESDLYVEWTGSYPALCIGSWIFRYKGVELDVPEDYIESPMYTEGIYSTWSFVGEWEEEWEYYEDGLDMDSWIDSNRSWLTKMFKDKGFEMTEELLEEIFLQVQSQDFRHNSCGGCI